MEQNKNFLKKLIVIISIITYCFISFCVPLLGDLPGEIGEIRLDNEKYVIGDSYFTVILKYGFPDKVEKNGNTVTKAYYSNDFSFATKEYGEPFDIPSPARVYYKVINFDDNQRVLSIDDKYVTGEHKYYSLKPQAVTLYNYLPSLHLIGVFFHD